MQWNDAPIENDENGKPMFRGIQQLKNDRGEDLGHVCWFYDEGPFYAHAVDLKEPDVIRRIGPCDTLDGAKAACLEVIEGTKDVSKRAGYPR